MFFFRVLAMTIFSFAASSVVADEPAAPTAEQQAEDQRRIAIIQEAAEMYKLYGDERREKPLTRSDKPLLRFDDPVTLASKGAVYVWSDAKRRPLAVASIYFQGNGTRVDEFQSLTTGELLAEFNDAVVWQPSLPGLEWKALEEAGKVPDTKALRLGKMRALARQFTASVTDPMAGRQELRLLPQPMYRYEDAERGIVDSALFSYAKGTNPEVLLVLQAEKLEGRVQWMYAFCRMTSRECEVQRSDQVIWKIAKSQFPQSPEDPYFNRGTR